MSASAVNSYIAMIKQDPANPRVIPATPIMQKVHHDAATIGAEISTTVSKNIRGDRRTSDTTIVGFSVGGGYSFEMTFDNSLNDELMLGFLWQESFTTNEAKDGEFYQPFFIERGHPDVSEYFKFIGMACNTWTMEFADQALVTGSYDFVGLQENVDQAIEPGATYTEVTINPVFSAVTNIPVISIDGVPQTECNVKDWTFTLANNVTPKTGVGILGACETNAKKLSITGDINIYFSNSGLYNKLLAGTPFSFEWTMTDDIGNSYTFLLPRLKLVSDAIPIENEDADIMNNASYVATYDLTEDCMLKVTRTPV